MKKIILSVLLVATFTAGYAQHTLSFNQAILVSSTQTVPAGAVWKVVSILPTSGAVSLSAYNNIPNATSYTINVNSTAISFSSVQAFAVSSEDYYAYGYAGASGDGKLPIWLPAGTTLAAGNNIQYVSVIEFLVN